MFAILYVPGTDERTGAWVDSYEIPFFVRTDECATVVRVTPTCYI